MTNTKSRRQYSNKEILEMAKKVSAKLNIPPQVVVMAYYSFWDNIKESIENLNLDSISEDSEITNPLSFNIGSIGKLYTSKERILKINNNKKYDREKNENI